MIHVSEVTITSTCNNNASDLAAGLLDLLKSPTEPARCQKDTTHETTHPEAGLHNNLVGCKDVHVVNLGSRF